MNLQNGSKQTRVVAAHGGVTFRESKNAVDACKKVIKHSEDAVGAAENLELCGCFNAGRGSSLTREGTVEMEAAVCRMDESGELLFGAVGASARLASPIRVAEALADSRREELNGLIDPLVLVAEGAEKWARDNDLEVLAEPIVSTEAEKEWKRAMGKINGSKLDDADVPRVMDTVGAVDFSVDDWSSTAACSSGGVILKRPGRLGHCTCFGAGVWVEKRTWMEDDRTHRRFVSLTLTGCGEAMVRVDAARSMARRITQRPSSMEMPEAISSFYQTDFNSENGLLRRVPTAHLCMGGVAVVREEKKKESIDGEEDDDDCMDTVELVFFHNTPFLPVAWRDERGRVRGIMSRREEGSEGVQVTVVPL
ncbi:hypothetical protein PFISCL1PPCAC_24648 [Pristionchus fissidentatus]|uniref:Uncharacterized protein n=1 Tax=Pristionchus fissidentatus TaxID=1538716 RepID=A0AAV5WQR2_9BILA|nr:hypothetical protein PFISCL1PPCAC_24648 [Pristionchus fissidentatus]